MGEFDEISYSKASKNTTQLAELSNQGQIKGFVVLTQVEYDALVTAGTVDPEIVYLIRG